MALIPLISHWFCDAFHFFRKRLSFYLLFYYIDVLENSYNLDLKEHAHNLKESCTTLEWMVKGEQK